MTGYGIPPSIQKSAKIRRAFEAKVEILEKWARSGLPKEIVAAAGQGGIPPADLLPRDNAKLMRWRGPHGDLDTWKDPTISRLGTGKNPDLAERFRVAVCDIELWISKKGGRVSELELQIEVLQGRCDRLAFQNAQLMGENQQLRDELSFEKSLPRVGGK